MVSCHAVRGMSSHMYSPVQDPPFKRTRLLPLSPPRSRGWLLSSPISPGLLTRSQSGKLR